MSLKAKSDADKYSVLKAKTHKFIENLVYGLPDQKSDKIKTVIKQKLNCALYVRSLTYIFKIELPG